MNDLFSELARDKEREFLREANQIRWLEDARRKGYKTDGTISRVARAILDRLTSVAI